jgi:hypothetical protein
MATKKAKLIPPASFCKFSRLAQHPRATGQLFFFVDQASVDDFQSSDCAFKALAGLCDDATNQLLTLIAFSARHCELRITQDETAVDERLLTEELRAQARGVRMVIERAAAFDRDGLIGMQQAGLLQVVQELEQSPQANARNAGEHDRS